jgi:adenylate cyclase
MALVDLYLLDSRQQRIESWKLEGKTIFHLGRGKDNDIVLPYSWVSRKHAMIQLEENGGCNLIDLGSSNGTGLNGRLVHAPMPLRSGDRLEIGKTILEFHQAAMAPAAVAMNEEDLDEGTVAFAHRAMVTVLICDIHDYTQLSRQIGDEAVSELLRLWTGIAARLVCEHGGSVDKFLGDAVMAVWRENGGSGEVVRQALAAVLALESATCRLGRDFPGLPWPLTVGAAINTGEAMMGNMGGGEHRDFTVIGDAVNLAFRLEELTSRDKGLDVLLGQDAVAVLPGDQHCFRQLECKIKDRQQPVLAYGCSFTQLRDYLRDSSANQPSR